MPIKKVQLCISHICPKCKQVKHIDEFYGSLTEFDKCFMCRLADQNKSQPRPPVGRSMTSIADEIGISAARLCNMIKARYIPPLPGYPARYYPDAEWFVVVRQYLSIDHRQFKSENYGHGWFDIKRYREMISRPPVCPTTKKRYYKSNV